MEKIMKELERFVATMEQKGYKGNFLTNGEFPDTLKGSISKYLETVIAKDSTNPNIELQLETYPEWKDEEQEHIVANMFVSLKNEKFELYRMDIRLRDRYGKTINSCSLEPISTVTLPDIKEAISKVKIQGIQKQAYRRRFRLGMILWLVLMFPLGDSIAQSTTWNEWFQQKKTKKKYLAEQIVAFQVYIEYLQKGYDIAQKGLTTISNIKNGDINLHQDFFNRLSMVNPKVKSYAKVADITALYISTMKVYQRTIRDASGSRLYQTEELAYFKRVFGRLLQDSGNYLEELAQLVSEGEWKLEDEQRLKRIDALYLSMQEGYDFAEKFSRAALMLGLNRKQEQRETTIGRTLYNLND